MNEGLELQFWIDEIIVLNAKMDLEPSNTPKTLNYAMLIFNICESIHPKWFILDFNKKCQFVLSLFIACLEHEPK
jgi:hypothetical protein